jgi:hypothetical protein
MRQILALCAAGALAGCMFVHENRDAETRPEVGVGTGATVIYPGQAPPPLGQPRQAGGAQGGAAPAGPDVTMIGGSSAEGSSSTKERQVPLIGPLTTLIGYPFWIFGKSLGEKADQASQEQASGGPSGAGAPKGHDEREQQRLVNENQRLLEELRQRRETGSAPPPPSSASGSGSGSIGQELAALQERLGRSPAGADPGAVRPDPAETPGEAVDRNDDGRPDLWVYSEAGRPVREVRDEDHDGRVDQIRSYDADGEMSRVEEDLDRDGHLEALTLYEGGEPVRRRVDTDGDGQPDAWSFYREGEVVRNEVDRDGDGFRDLLLVYEQGELVREEEDQDGDGRADVIVHYEEGEVLQRDEDLDHDGTPDIQSFYEGGKLVRREVLSESLLQSTPKGSGS